MENSLDKAKPGQVRSVKWTDIELTAVIKAYLGMLRNQVGSKPFNKREVNRKLRMGELVGRSSSSIELRMQNISAVLVELGRPRLIGYVPAANVGSNVKDRIIAILKKNNIAFFDPFVATANPELLAQRVDVLLKMGPIGAPIGVKKPAISSVVRLGFARDPAVRAWTLKNAQGICEGCKQPAPFMDSKGLPFLEVHHVRHLAQHGSDCISNTVALCPNCHRRCHIADDRDEFTASLFEKNDRLVAEPWDGTETVFIENIEP